MMMVSKLSEPKSSLVFSMYFWSLSLEVPSNSCMQHIEGTYIASPLDSSVSESPLSGSGEAEVKDQQQGECQGSDNCNYPPNLQFPFL